MKAAAAALLLTAGAACAVPSPLPDGGRDTPNGPPAVTAASVPRAPAKSARVLRSSRYKPRPAAPVPVKEPRRKLTKTQPLPVGHWNWDAVAKCESGGHWHHPTSANGYWGGLQMTLTGWRSYHGDRYAPRPDLASKAQQIAVAEHWLRAQGWGAWPTCGRFA